MPTNIVRKWKCTLGNGQMDGLFGMQQQYWEWHSTAFCGVPKPSTAFAMWRIILIRFIHSFKLLAPFCAHLERPSDTQHCDCAEKQRQELESDSNKSLNKWESGDWSQVTSFPNFPKMLVFLSISVLPAVESVGVVVQCIAKQPMEASCPR